MRKNPGVGKQKGANEAEYQEKLSGGSNEGRIEALLEIVRVHNRGEIPVWANPKEIVKAVMKVNWGAQESLKTMSAEDVSKPLFNLKVGLLALLQKEIKNGGDSKGLFGAFCEEGIRFDPANISFARGLMVSAFNAGKYSSEAIKTAGVLLCCGVLRNEDRKQILEMLENAQEMGVDLSSAELELHTLSTESENGNRTRISVHAGILAAGIGKSVETPKAILSSWLPGGKQLRGDGPLKNKVRKKGEPTGKIKI